MKNIHTIFWMGIMLAVMPVVASEDSGDEDDSQGAQACVGEYAPAKRSRTNGGGAAAGGGAARMDPKEVSYNYIKVWKKKGASRAAYNVTINALQSIKSRLAQHQSSGDQARVNMNNLESVLQNSDRYTMLSEKFKKKLDSEIQEIKAALELSPAERAGFLKRSITPEQVRLIWEDKDQLDNLEADFNATANFFSKFKYRVPAVGYRNAEAELNDLADLVKNSDAYKKLAKREKDLMTARIKRARNNIRLDDAAAADVLLQLGNLPPARGGSGDDEEDAEQD